jgi:hypothetical protein
MADILVQRRGVEAAEVAFTPVDASNTFQNDGKSILLVKNGGSASVNVTLKTASAGALGNTLTRVYAIAAGDMWSFGPLSTNPFNNDVGQSGFDVAPSADVTAAVLGG